MDGFGYAGVLSRKLRHVYLYADSNLPNGFPTTAIYTSADAERAAADAHARRLAELAQLQVARLGAMYARGIG